MPARRELLAGLAAALACPALALPEPQNNAVRRQYLDGPFGQLHLRIARPDDGHITAPPLVLLHQSPLSGRMFDKLLPRLANRRLAIAVDTPGYGESDRPRERPSLAAYGDAIVETVARAYGGPFDLLGYHTGAAIAADVAARRPRDVRRLVLIAVPFFDAARRAELLRQFAAKPGYADDGSHLLPLWTGSFRARPEGQSLDDVARLVAEKQRAGLHGEWALAAAMEVDLAPALSALRQPTLVLAPHDGLQDESAAAAKLIPNARLLALARYAYGLFDAAPEEIARLVGNFLDS
jgi:pimeloyl-ACP methyl ester carboxylesterase